MATMYKLQFSNLSKWRLGLEGREVKPRKGYLDIFWNNTLSGALIFLHVGINLHLG